MLNSTKVILVCIYVICKWHENSHWKVIGFRNYMYMWFRNCSKGKYKQWTLLFIPSPEVTVKDFVGKESFIKIYHIKKIDIALCHRHCYYNIKDIT